jgi:uncharacterized membrane protein
MSRTTTPSLTATHAPARAAELAAPGRATWWIATGLALAGALVAGYLITVHYTGQAAFCSGVGGCETVNSSPYSVLFGVPVAAYGFATYLVVAACSLWQARHPSPVLTWPALVAFGLAVVGVLFSAWLTYLELFVIHAICPWCVTSAVIVTLLAAVTGRGVWSAS